ncbi:antitoxin [Candidatus Termititenax aidoneus]|uniref:Antitoxin n=1 Tax=Termititenax aidoneus TaxID=2218524 RepID=A0A388TG70_TERA1|nr:antitoxin [Candidatus Termititenax aidoneus]
MPQISLYIDSATLNKITRSARQDELSLSKWVGANLQRIVDETYPPGFFDLFGSVKDSSMLEPPEIPAHYDIPRAQI